LRNPRRLASIRNYSNLFIVCLNLILNIEISGILAIVLLICVMAPIFTLIIGWKEYYPIDFIEIGKLQITESNIEYKDKKYVYEKIQKLTFQINDFKGKRLNSPGILWDAGPSLSQGVDNRLTFEIQNEKIELDFQLQSETELKRLGKILKELYLKKKKKKKFWVF